MKMFHSIDEKDRLYVLKAGNGFSCIGFDVCEKRIVAMSKELRIDRKGSVPGTEKHYNEYLALVEIVRKKNAETGWRLSSELEPRLIGLEGHRVEVNGSHGKRRFIVGKSTGCIPCHLEIKRSNSMGGGAVLLWDDDKITVVSEKIR
jgi:hypothetical protein